MDIKSKIRKEIETPGGYKVIIRKLNLFSFMETGTLPNIFTSKAKTAESLAKEVEKNPATLKLIFKICLVEGVVGGDLNIVDKTPRECISDELSYKEVPQDDAVSIINTVLEFSDMAGGGATEQAKPFSKKQKSTSPA
jgi:hypothetical protein